MIELIDLHAEEHPVLYRIAAQDPDDVDALSRRLRQELDDISASVSNVDDRLAATPVERLTQDDPSPISTLGRHLEETSERGPWEYPMLIEEALQDLHGSAPSVGRVATGDVLALAGLGPDLAESAAITGTLVALSVAAPPVALALSVALSTNEVVLAVRDYRRAADAANVAFDASLGLLPPPSGGELVFRVAGAVADILPGKVAGAVSILAPVAADSQN